MIGRLRGVLAEVEADHCLIDCAGVGYVVACGARTLDRLPSISWHEQLAPLDVPSHAVLRTMPDYTSDAAMAQQ
jgi:hypothetical protein